MEDDEVTIYLKKNYLWLIRINLHSNNEVKIYFEMIEMCASKIRDGYMSCGIMSG